MHQGEECASDPERPGEAIAGGLPQTYYFRASPTNGCQQNRAAYQPCRGHVREQDIPVHEDQSAVTSGLKLALQ
jgi:hypothetical protein